MYFLERNIEMGSMYPPKQNELFAEFTDLLPNVARSKSASSIRSMNKKVSSKYLTGLQKAMTHLNPF